MATNQIEYGTTTQYGFTNTAGAGTGAQSKALAGLTTGTLYHYRIAAYANGYTTYTAGRDIHDVVMVMQENDERRGRTAYEAYSANTGGRSLASGDDLPMWDDLQDVYKTAWIAAALAVVAGE